MSLEAFFKHYRDCYSQLDAAGVTGHFTVPFTAIHQGELSCWQDRDTLDDTTAALLEWYRSQGFSSASHRLLSVMPMGPSAAAAVVAWTVERQGRAPWSYHTGYHLKKVGGEWKIYGLVQYDTEPEQQTFALEPAAASGAG
ncbi:hypothetical protein [Chromobacterium alticapitis]|uniref:SnoaL-like domain-containing protein n=1 Tax=Chromobacterium alticapitis TaxID=2073169 RepID=A0A2S5DBC2_9NEIS|nr:hypothetical protein [Chromobacterium alticapitis]POZ60385.1 hypothetical protein C2I19_19140 [Chromobacterium alticapitis]